ncbi:DNA helicase [Photobacterium ganghwense]|uniref:DNA helicase n=1 Tax=Photobacterium ganghwense TaxID=320778 RepID=A0A0J1HET9_9GAMM|nr:ATPase domain-containing protein [Photobacterium ganghwense]KLV10165.1 DNA helicase [Photobacterium ganghwense]PSU05413.1 DNA helicase [Photobacterium ganghwense]
MTTEFEVTSVPLSEKFDSGFQLRLAAYYCRDTNFLTMTNDLVSPEQFENKAVASLVMIVNKHFRLYSQAPGKKVLVDLVKKAIESKRIREEMKPDVLVSLKEILSEPLTDSKYMLDQVSTFARNNALDEALMKAVELKEKGDFEGAVAVVQKAMLVGASDSNNYYDYYEEVDTRTERRDALEKGEDVPTGITTGIRALDAILYHKGWGRREMTLIMGGAKAGKSTALGDFSIAASDAGYNVLYVTLEVHARIISDRADARVSDTSMDDLVKAREAVRSAILAKRSGGVGKLIIVERPAGTFTPNELNRLIHDFRAKGVKFDMVALDYLDLARSNRVTNDRRADEKDMYTDFRGLADKEDFALLTATQTNRDGMGSETAGITHVADNIEKIRIADLTISINKTDEEKAKGEARLFLAASRNQRGDITVRVKQDLDKMKFVDKVLDVF